LVLALLLVSGTNQRVNNTPIVQELAQFNLSAHAQNTRPQTVMIYMNGSDLETEIGAATVDLMEILESGLASENAHVVILTGGAKYWQNDVVPSNQCVLWMIEDGWLYEVEEWGLLNMGDPETLIRFIKYGMEYFPAEKYGLVLWDHGGGAIAGYGHDEKFYDEGSLTLAEMDYAFHKAGLEGKSLEWLGFDSCLMATVEMALVAEPYAKYLIASEDLEPGDGWDYVFLNLFNRYPHADGYTVGREIVDTFMDFFGSDSDEILTLSVTDLSKVYPVAEAMGKLMTQASGTIINDYSMRRNAFSALATRRSYTKTFGEGSPRDNYSDMVDIGDMAWHLSDLFPEESADVIAALDEAVLYNRHNSDTPLYGLSAFYIYGGKSIGFESLTTYNALNMNEYYTQYLHQFYVLLTERSTSRTRRSREMISSDLTLWQPADNQGRRYRMVGIRSADTGLHKQEKLPSNMWPSIEGYPVCLYPAGSYEKFNYYAIPAQVNGKDCDIIVSINKNSKNNELNKENDRNLKGHPECKILGSRYDDGLVKQKGYDPLTPDDKVAFYYLERDFNSDFNSKDKAEWHLTPEINLANLTNLTNKNPLQLQWTELSGEYYTSLRHTDVYNEVHFEPLIPLR